jgi:hypothetical protein
MVMAKPISEKNRRKSTDQRHPEKQSPRLTNRSWYEQELNQSDDSDELIFDQRLFDLCG